MAESTIANGAGRRIRLENLLLTIVQFAVVLGVLYSTWHFGAVQSLALQRLCFVAGIGLVAAIGLTGCRSDSIHRLPIPLWILLAVWILYAFAQTTPLPSGLNIWFARAEQQSDEFRRNAFELSDSAQKLANISPIEPGIASGSAIREATFQAVVPYLLALSFSILASIGFQQDRERKALLWAIVINATVMATWGIVQRSGGGIELLPGIENKSGGSLFGSFVYKNAGAAALLPALACLAAIVLMRSRRTSSGYKTSVPSTQFSSLTNQLEKLFIPFCLFLAGILITGLIASLSRGAWLAALLTLLVVGGVLGGRSLSRGVFVALAGGIALMIGIVVATGIGSDIQHQAKRVSVDTVLKDQRWDVWLDSCAAALAYFPSGSGLGTYGYAALPFQSGPRTEWFRDAHNQYLETLTETGLIGIVVVMLGMIWFGRISYRLLRTGKGKIRLGSVRSAMGMLGASLLLCGAIQNSVDFVIKIPAILLLYSILISVVATTRLEARTTRKGRTAIRTAKQPVIAPMKQVAWMVISLVCVMIADRIANRQVDANRILGASAVTGIIDDKADQELEIKLQRLDAAIARQPQRAKLYLRRARALAQQYQRNLIQSADEIGISLAPENASLATIHALLETAPAWNREALRSDFVRTPELVKPLGRMLADLHTAILLNPFDPHTQYECALVSPLGSYSIDPWLKQTSALDNSNYKVLYNNGLLAYYQDDHDQMMAQWSNSLAIRHSYLKTILDLAAQKVPLSVVVQQLVPDRRPEHIVALAKRYQSVQPATAANSAISELLGVIQGSSRFKPADRHAILAGLHQLLGNQDLAIDHWEQSLRLQPMNSRFRVSLVAALSDRERWEDALDHAVLGQRLFPSDRRFDHQSRKIRRSLIDIKTEEDRYNTDNLNK